MNPEKLLFYFSLLISTLLAQAGFIQTGLWVEVIASIFCAFFWIFFRKRIPSVCLVLSISIAVIGIIFKVPSSFLLIYSGFSMICWDLTLLELSLNKNVPDQKAGLYRWLRIKSLALSLVLGIAVYFINYLFKFQIPFFVMILLVTGVFICFFRIFKIFKHFN